MFLNIVSRDSCIKLTYTRIAFMDPKFELHGLHVTVGCCIHTYITYLIGHYNSSVRITTQHLTSLTLPALILYLSGGTCSLKSTSNDRFLRSFSQQFYFTLRIFARNLQRGNRLVKYFHIFVFLMSDLEFDLGPSKLLYSHPN